MTSQILWSFQKHNIYSDLEGWKL